VISGTLPANASATSPYTVTVTATDAQGATTTDTFTWTVTNPAPTVMPIADQSNTDGAAINLNVAPSFSDDDALTYTATGLPAGLTISGAGVISGTLPANASAGGPYTVTVTATDAQGATTTDTFTWTVTNPAPTVTPIADQSNTDGAAINLNVAPSFSDDDALTYTATGLPAGLTISGAGVISGTLPANASTGGPYTVTVTATDAQGVAITDTFTWAVTNPAPTVVPIGGQTSSDGSPVNFNVAPSFSDDDALTYTATGLPPGLAISPTGVITGTLPANASAGGPYTVTITGTDSQGAAVSTQFVWTVNSTSTTPPPSAAGAGGESLYNVIKQFLGVNDSPSALRSGDASERNGAVSVRPIVEVFQEGSRTSSTLPLEMSVHRRHADDSAAIGNGAADATLPITTHVVDHGSAWSGRFYDGHPAPIIVDNNKDGAPARPGLADPLEGQRPSPDDRSEIFNDVLTLIGAVADKPPEAGEPAEAPPNAGFKTKLRAEAAKSAHSVERVSKLVRS
jgi:hypothetical protein